MSDDRQGQVTHDAAAAYERAFVPALFAEWAPRVAEAAHLRPGDRVLDVGCGTGVLAREAARRVAPDGQVVGIDRNAGMIDVARRLAPAVEWRLAPAEALPFPQAGFDAVVSQFALMFFDDRVGALSEMRRVLRPVGRLAVAVWDRIEASPGYAAMAGLLEGLFGESVAREMRAPYALGDPERLHALGRAAGFPEPEVATLAGTARFPSLDAWVRTDIRAWTLADRLDDAQFESLRAAADDELARFAGPDGAVSFPVSAHILTALRL